MLKYCNISQSCFIKCHVAIIWQYKNVSVSITDMNGRKLWQNNSSDVMFVNLPVEKYVAGVYFVTVTNGTESKTIRLVKQ
ncbi:MAG: T9SS type A sorting domain-containing protein [Bacteroidota bacterium]